ncbi:MAG: hypothetical protein ABF306_14655 [Nocardioides marinisabuli]|uniref:hypothetical protein n=1 Tax=Nocardioides marinisabuli TaxID=419476 RepID=UPI00321AFDEA
MSLSRLVLPVLPALVITVLPGLAAAADPGGAAPLPEAAAATGAAAQDAEQATPRRAGQDRTAEKQKRAKKAGLEPGTLRGAAVVKTGWWYVANEPPPDTGVVAAPQPPSPNTPAGAMPVAALLGETAKLSAIEFSFEAEPGSSIDRFEMVLQESGEPAAALGSDVAALVACPVTEVFWADGQGAAWKNRPAHDCELASAVGERDEDGRWSFDLTEVAAGWLETDFVGSRSVVLVEQADAPVTFDVSFAGPGADGVGLEVRTTAPDAVPGGEGTDGGSTDGGGTTGSSDGGGGSLGGSTGTEGLGGFDDGGGGGGGGDLGDLGAPGSSDPGAGADGAGGSVDGDLDAAAAPVSAMPAWYSGLPRSTVVLLPLVLGLAYLMMLALGPAGRPDPAANRRGVSRALDRLRETRTLALTKVAR